MKITQIPVNERYPAFGNQKSESFTIVMGESNSELSHISDIPDDHDKDVEATLRRNDGEIQALLIKATHKLCGFDELQFQPT
mmetsp:Transcript_30334/g.54941  ORF Transcript_30334/g.54941 Transcript_30334/m.54941 type:complete len:82 (-) Transcript_30334:204-449(-)